MSYTAPARHSLARACSCIFMRALGGFYSFWKSETRLIPPKYASKIDLPPLLPPGIVMDESVPFKYSPQTTKIIV